MRKLRRTLNTSIRSEPPVMIARPHSIEGKTLALTDDFIQASMLQGIADFKRIPSKSPELARNNAINAFLKEPLFRKKSHLFFVDDDSPPENKFAIQRLLSHNRPVICGVTPIIMISGKRVFNFNAVDWSNVTNFDCFWSAVVQDEEGKFHNIGIDELPNKPFKVYRTGGTCLLIRRDVIEKLKPPYQITQYNEDWTSVSLSEDYYFCDKIREAGFEIWCDPAIECHHYHQFDLLSIFAIYRQIKGAYAGN